MQYSRKKDMRHVVWKVRDKTVSISRWHDCLHRKKNFKTYKRLLQLNKFNEVVRHKVNVKNQLYCSILVNVLATPKVRPIKPKLMNWIFQSKKSFAL